MRWLLASLLWLVMVGPAQAAPLKVMTFNVRVPVAADGADAWPNRRAALVATIRNADPDVIGTQELVREQGAAIVDALPQFGWFGTGRRGGRDDEHMGVFYRRDRLALARMGEFWLSDTPERAGSISWGHPYPRMVTWGEFRRRSDGRRFVLANTHFPYRAEDEAARERAARLLDERMGGIAGDLPIVVTGDFNSEPEGGAYRVLTRRLTDAWTIAARRTGPDGTFHGFAGRGDRRIDWILVRRFGVERVATLTDRPRGRYPSDHFPVQAWLDWEK